jgi:hypothetical protein
MHNSLINNVYYYSDYYLLLLLLLLLFINNFIFTIKYQFCYDFDIIYK